MSTKKLYEYRLELTSDSEKYTEQQIDSSYKDHEKTMNGFEVDNSYRTKEFFFKKWFYAENAQRFRDYAGFIMEHLTEKEESILSVACGRPVVEPFLFEQGYKNIILSDLEISKVHEATNVLFSNVFKIKKIDLMKDLIDEKFDHIICLSFIYLLNEEQLVILFRNMARNLKDGGGIILDATPSLDNLWVYSLHNVVRKFENKIMHMVRKKRGLNYKIIKKHKGYRRNDDDIIKAAELAGFSLKSKKKMDYLGEARKSVIVNIIMNKIPSSIKIVEAISRKMGIAYTRLFYFQLK